MIDAGHGMDPATLKEATAPFFTTKGVGKGTGLGLSMVQGLMAQTNGKLVLRSQEGVGTTAELWLPSWKSPSGRPHPTRPARQPRPARRGHPDGACG